MKSSCPPSKVCLPWVSKRGIRDVPGILPGCPGPLRVFKKLVQKSLCAFFVPYFLTAMIAALHPALLYIIKGTHPPKHPPRSKAVCANTFLCCFCDPKVLLQGPETSKVPKMVRRGCRRFFWTQGAGRGNCFFFRGRNAHQLSFFSNQGHSDQNGRLDHFGPFWSSTLSDSTLASP